MQACIAALTILLSGQVEADRYDLGPDVADAPAAAADAEPMFQYTDQPTAPTPASPSTAGLGDAADANRTPGAPVEYSYPGGSPVTPAASPDATAAPAAGAIQPRDLIGFLMQPPVGGDLSGTPVSLADAVAPAASRQAQTQLAEAYWDLSASVADYYLALQEAAELTSLSASIAAPGAAWQQAESKQQLRTTAALRTAQAAQSRLRGLMGVAANAPLPLPADLPHAGRYDSQYGNIFANRDNAVAKQLNDLLPVEYNNIANLATAVGEADQWLSLVSERRSPDTTGEGLLRAHDLLSLHRREFIDAVRHYNHHIAEYSELATPGQVGTRRLVAMLIKTSAQPDGQWRDPNVRAAGAYEPELAVDDQPQTPQPSIEMAPARPTYVPPAGAPQTAGSDSSAAAGFAGAETRRVRRPIIDVLRSREHSILRRPLSRVRGNRR